jgi:hypothetical protein
MIIVWKYSFSVNFIIANPIPCFSRSSKKIYIFVFIQFPGSLQYTAVNACWFVQGSTTPTTNFQNFDLNIFLKIEGISA